MVSIPPCVIHEDEHLVVVNKPAGWNTHAPSPFHGEGIHEWLKHREPKWSSLAIIHRLDKFTSGVLVFAKTPQANRSLTEQFATRKTRKTYHLLSTKPLPKEYLVVRSKIQRVGEKYVSGSTGEFAETHFASKGRSGAFFEIEANPVTGRTHQIRVHASENGFPILGDFGYGGAAFPRVCLHAASLQLRHPATGQALHFQAAAQFEIDPFDAYRKAFIGPDTNAFRCLNGASDNSPGFYLERWGDYLLITGESEPDKNQIAPMESYATAFKSRGVYYKQLNRKVRSTKTEEAAPKLVKGEMAPETFSISENGVKYEASFAQGYSVGLFLDQRENRRRVLNGYIASAFPRLELAGKEVLNTFAYTCAFSVCAALSGARVTSLDLSKKYLDWGRRNFEANNLDPNQHDFIYGDVFEWAHRFGKNNRSFDMVLLDPPTFSQAKTSGIFQAEKHYGKLVAAILPLLKPNGILFASTNAQKYKPEQFLADVKSVITTTKRSIAHQHYVPQPPDFPISREEPAYLKTAWFQIR